MLLNLSNIIVWYDVRTIISMKRKLEKIILFCDKAMHAKLVINLIQKTAKNIQISLAANFRQLSSLLREKIPDLILIHTLKPENRQKTIISRLRKNKAADHIPVLIYLSKNVDDGLVNMLKKFESL